MKRSFPDLAAVLPEAEEFFAEVDKPADGCWLWPRRNIKGYGRFRRGSKTWNAHRVAWIICNGAVPPGFVVCHRCDVPACVNPDHLFIGTMRDNMRDAYSKGRMKGVCVAGTPRRSKWESIPKKYDVDSAMAEHLSGVHISVIARKFGVHRSTLSLALKRKRGES